ncbi:integrator complex subunit 9-like [Episyrphus balteatus]|uniref:integrator complex subunit 9-like n=1 Tax=Episyrphus balteatus TaxID=286459 RepID=UPI002485A023|nr:integrator complex subunit 9-like [Episyrphus balteatus]
MKAFYCPIDTSLNYQQANKLIKELKPRVLVIPEYYTKPHPIAPQLYIEQADKKIITFKCGEIIRLPLKRKMDRVYLTSELASKIVPREITPGVTISTLFLKSKIKYIILLHVMMNRIVKQIQVLAQLYIHLNVKKF